MKKNFSDNKPHPDNNYFKTFQKYLASLPIDSFDNIIENPTFISKVNEVNSHKILSHLIDLACDAQNGSNIIIGRYFIQNQPKDWLIHRLRPLLLPFLHTGDYWNFGRALELVYPIDASLTQEIAHLALSKDDADIQEYGRDFLDED